MSRAKRRIGFPGKLGEPPVSTTNAGMGSPRLYQVPGSSARFSPVVVKKEEVLEVIDAERNAKAERWTKAVLVSS
jgi:hypothetical protein